MLGGHAVPPVSHEGGALRQGRCVRRPPRLGRAQHASRPDESIEDRLQRIAEAVVEMMLQLMPRVMMMKSRLNLSPAEMFASLGASPPAEAILHLTRYL